MTTYKLLLLPGDGIGPEVMGEVSRLVSWINAQGLAKLETETDLVGGCAYDSHGEAISEATMNRALAADAVMLGAVGGPKWDGVALRQAPRGRAAPPAQGPSSCSPISGPRSAIPRSPTPPRSSATGSTASTS